MAFDPISSIQRWWLRLRPEQKRNIKVASGLAVVVSLATAGDLLYKSNKPNLDAQLMQEEQTSNTALMPQVGNLTLQETQEQVQELNDTIQKLQDQATNQQTQDQQGFDALNKTLGDLEQQHALSDQAAANGVSTADQQKINDLEQQMSQMQQQLAAQATIPTSGSSGPSDQAMDLQVSSAGSGQSLIAGGGIIPPPPPGGAATGAASGSIAPPAAPGQIVTVGTNSSGVPTVNVAAQQGSVFVPAGSILTGVMINGIDASTADDAQADPTATLIRLKTDTLLPNRYRMDLIDCHVLASGYGDLSDARAILRSNILSCVTPQGGVITVPLEAYVVGPDGLAGVPGTVISHQGTLLTKSMIAGLLSGFSTSAQSTQEPILNVNPTGTVTYQSPNFATLGQNSLMAGAGQGAANVAQFYLKEAEALAPVVQVNPGVAVNLITIKGVHLDLTGSTRAPILNASVDSASSSDANDTNDDSSSSMDAQTNYGSDQQSPGGTH